MDRTLRIASVTLVLAASVLALTACAPGARSGAGSKGPLAVVLTSRGARTSVTVVDLRQHRVVRRIALRSLATDLDVDERTGLVVAAQTGGIGDEADDALSLIDPRTGSVRYVTLPVRDPANVVCVNGKAFVLHSVVTAEGLLVSVVDVSARTVVARRAVPDGPGLWCAAAGSLWTGRLRESGGWDVVRIDPATFESTTLEVPTPPVTGVFAADGVVALLSGSQRSAAGGAASITLIDPTSATVVASLVATELTFPARIAARTGDAIVVGDWGGQAPESRRLAVLDTRSRALRPPIEIDGVPCAMAGGAGELLVVERTRGQLISIDMSGRIRWEVDLGTGPLSFADLAVAERQDAAR